MADLGSDDVAMNLDGLFDEAMQATQRPPELPITEELARDHERYVDGGEIARGGLKCIRIVEDADTGRILAMAVPKDDSPEGGEAFLREARITANLTHPSIIPVYDVGLGEGGRPYFVMKLVEGGNLSECVKRRTGPDAIPELKTLGARVDLFLKICEAIAYAHSRGVLHLDLKPANVQVGRFGEVLVCDWGLAKIQDESCEDPLLERYSFDDHERRNITLSGRIKGTPGYMAPEQCGAFASRKDARTDVFSLGCMLYELAAFRRPIATGDVRTSVEHTRKGTFRDIPSTVPPGLAAVIAKALQFRPENRYPTVDALITDLVAWRQGFATGAEGAGVKRQISLFYRRNRAACLFGAAVAAVILSMATAFVIRLQASERHAIAALAQAESEQRQRRELGNQASPLLLKRALDAMYSGQRMEAAALVASLLRIDERDVAAGNLKADLLFLDEQYADLEALYREPLTPFQSRLRTFAINRRGKSEAPLSEPEVMPLIRHLVKVQPAEGLTFLEAWLENSDSAVRDAAAAGISKWSLQKDLPRVLGHLPQLPARFHDPVSRRILESKEKLPFGALEDLLPTLLTLELSVETRESLRSGSGTNLAIGASIRSSGLSEVPPEVLIDGDLTSLRPWISNSSSEEIVIDLGRLRRVASVALFPEADLPAVRVDLSRDGNEFTKVGDKPSIPMPEGECPLVFWLPSALEARYVRLRLRSYDGGKQIALREIQVRDPFSNLALGRPTSSSEIGLKGASAYAVNGVAPRSQFWEENVPPVYWQVDFGSVYSITRTRAAFYYDGRRYYQYEILVSNDGRNFTRVVDRRKNTDVSQEEPYVDRFESVHARFVRVKVWKNSANPGVHIREFEVFPAAEVLDMR